MCKDGQLLIFGQRRCLMLYSEALSAHSSVLFSSTLPIFGMTNSFCDRLGGTSGLQNFVLIPNNSFVWFFVRNVDRTIFCGCCLYKVLHRNLLPDVIWGIVEIVFFQGILSCNSHGVRHNNFTNLLCCWYLVHNQLSVHISKNNHTEFMEVPLRHPFLVFCLPVNTNAVLFLSTFLCCCCFLFSFEYRVEFYNLKVLCASCNIELLSSIIVI